MMDDQQAEELYKRFTTLQGEATELKEHFERLQEQLQNIARTREALKTLQQLEGSTEAWISIAPGAYVPGKVDKPQTVLLNIGADIAVEKRPEEVERTLVEHELQLEQLSEHTLTRLREALDKLEAIREEVK